MGFWIWVVVILTKLKKKLLNSFRVEWTVPTEQKQQELDRFTEPDIRRSYKEVKSQIKKPMAEKNVPLNEINFTRIFDELR